MFIPSTGVLGLVNSGWTVSGAANPVSALPVYHQVVYCSMALSWLSVSLALPTLPISLSVRLGRVCTCRRSAAQWWMARVGHRAGLLLKCEF